MRNEPRHGLSSPTATVALPVRRWTERRPVVLAVSAALFCAVFALRAADENPADVAGLLYVVPIALVALELGLLAGVAAAGLALVLLSAWALDADVAAAGIATRGVAFLAVGALAGRFSDRMRDAQRRQTRLLESAAELAHLTAGDELAATLARHARELVAASGAQAQLNGSPAGQSGAMDGRRHELAIETRGRRHGTLTVARPGALRSEDQAALAILGLQAAVAQDNRWLLESERERAAIRARLHEADRRLAERGVQLRELIAGQEAQRRRVSHELHEQAAQTLAAVLMGLGALERRLGSELGPVQVGALRSHVDGTMRALRALAESLRPPSLELGLEPALERLAEDARAQGPIAVTVELGDATGLDPDTETMIYRVVEEALSAGGDATRSLTVRTESRGRDLVIALDTGEERVTPEKLAALSARLELVGGTLGSAPAGVRAVIPLTSGRPPEGVDAA